ncbi:MAG: futalosine hydrolase [Flavobacteriales bacterium]|nr:futalosine hydrolase [Flavobacteriales bacterium]|tara:strand:- start:278 stop:856 length:579 start_codon:yes stop_codon:yes gene_type:complete
MKVLIVVATNFEITSDKLKIHPVLVTGIGMVNTSINLTRELSKNSYDLVINMGIAGSFKDFINIGDVVEITEDSFSEIGFENNNQFNKFSEFDIKTSFTVNPKSTLTRVKSITVNTVHGNAQSISEIVERENTDIESMEGAAVFNVCEDFNTNCIQIRSISNKVEARNKDNWDIKTAISNLNNEVERIITNL